MVAIVQLVRISVCGTEGRGFEPHWPPSEGLAGVQDLFLLNFSQEVYSERNREKPNCLTNSKTRSFNAKMTFAMFEIQNRDL